MRLAPTLASAAARRSRSADGHLPAWSSGGSAARDGLAETPPLRPRRATSRSPISKRSKTGSRPRPSRASSPSIPRPRTSIAVAARLCGVALALEPNRACYIPLAHRPGDGLDFSGAGEIAQLPMEHALPRLKALLEDDSVLKIGQNIKYDLVVMRRYGVRLAPYDDTMLMAYAVRPGPRRPCGLRHGRAVEAPSRAYAHRLQRCGGQRQGANHVRLRARGQGDGIRRRRRRRDVAALAPLQGAACGRGHGRGLRDAGAPHARRSGRDGACRRHGGPRRALAAFRRVQPKPRALRGRDLRAGRVQIQHRLDACRSRICCSASSACRARKRPRPANGAPARRCWKSWLRARN